MMNPLRPLLLLAMVAGLILGQARAQGCMDDTACNFAPTAIFDDGSCEFCSCLDSVQVLTASFPSDIIPGYSLEIELIADHDTTGITTNILGTPDPRRDEDLPTLCPGRQSGNSRSFRVWQRYRGPQHQHDHILLPSYVGC